MASPSPNNISMLVALLLIILLPDLILFIPRLLMPKFV